MPQRSYDALILGAGPAGCAAATVLARNGHTVGLVRPNDVPAGALGESVPPSARRILEELGFVGVVEQADFFPNRGNSVWWAGADVRRETFPEGQAGFHTDRTGLESVLVGAAADAGVTVLENLTARSAKEEPDCWTIRADPGSDVLTARWVIDATGRRGLIARTEGREPDPDTTTLALVGRWRRPGGWNGDDAHDTLIESYADGWAWSVPLSHEVRCFTAMVDQRHSDLVGASANEMISAELDKTAHVGPKRRGATALGEAWACPASLYTSVRFGRPGLLLVGDAGSSIDPLSSFGVKKALSSGWLGGIVAHTALTNAPMTQAAVDFFDRRERDVYRRYRQASVPFFEGAAAAHGTTFWEERAEAARRTTGAGDRPAPDLDGFGPDVPETDVRQAFEEIRLRDTLAAVRAPDVRTFERAAVRGDLIVLAQHMASPAYPEGIRYARGVDLLRLVEVAPAHPEVPDGWAAYNGVAPPVSLPDYLTALATAFAAGLLVHGERPD